MLIRNGMEGKRRGVIVRRERVDKGELYIQYSVRLVDQLQATMTPH
jgi:hypothetical protein